MLATGAETAIVPIPLVTVLAEPGKRERRYGGASAELLAESGYVEEEYFLTGTGNIYDYGEGGTPRIKSTAVPFTTQLIIRRPQDTSRFSGTVVLEPMHRAGAWGMTFGTCWDYFIGQGDAFAQIIPGRFHMLNGPLQLDEKRYAPLNLTDEGQLWDMLSQTGRLLKSDVPENPLQGVRQLLMSGTSGTSLMLLTYLGDGFDRRHRMLDGAPIFDGYLPYAAHGSLTYYRICSPARGVNGVGDLTPHPSEQIPMDDARRTVRGHDAPVVQVVTECEVIVPFSPPPVTDLMLNMYNNGLPVPQRLLYRREDSDDPGDLYRLYEIAGSGHDSSLAETTQRILGLANLPTLRMGRPRAPTSSFPVKYPLAAAFHNLKRWAAEGVAPPRAERIVVDEASVSLVRDEDGNARGGLRTPYVDVPSATYTGVNPGAALMGTEEPFTRERLHELYGDHETYVQRVSERCRELVDDRWLLGEDAEAIVTAARAASDRF